MRVYFYHTQNIRYMLERYRRGEFPGHLLYGATHFGEYGIDVTWHQFIASTSRLKRMLLTTWRVLRQSGHIDAVYATHYTGIEPLIFLRALGLFRKPIVIWHHQPIVKSASRWRDLLGRLFYRGIDEMIFFSQKLIDDSVRTGKAQPGKMHLGYWGADLDYYDRLLARQPKRGGFISSGKEMRDMPTLVAAFNATGAPLDIYLNRNNGDTDYEHLFGSLQRQPNVRLHFTAGWVVPELAEQVNSHACAVVCCRETKYTVGLTTVVEALALGIPMICSRNPQIPIDMEREGCGISVPYYDVEGWKQAIAYMQTHPAEVLEMGKKGRRLAESTYNDRHCAEIAAGLLMKYQ